MSTMTLKNKVVCGTFKETEKRNISLAERFRNYITENSAVIVSGLAALNGNTNAFNVYRMLSK